MKKQLFALLLAALLAPSTSSNIQAGVCSKTASGAWQIVKIGGGLILVTAGAGFAFVPCCTALGFGAASCLTCGLDKEMSELNGACTCCCATTGFVVGAPTAIAGGVLIKSGIKGLKKIFSHKKKKHHHEHVDIVVHTDED